MASDTLPPRKFTCFAAVNRYNELVLAPNAAPPPNTVPLNVRVPQPEKGTMSRHRFAILLSLFAAVASSGIFLDALFHQYALVEIAASVVTGFQVFFLSSAIADLLEKKNKTSPRRNSWVIVFTIFLFAFYSFTRYFH